MSVGNEPDAKIWHLPKKLLVRHSSFFEAALDGYFAESTSKSITLPEDDPVIFELFIRWLYIGDLNKKETVVDWEVERLTKAWILGDKLGSADFQDYAMLRLIHYHKYKPMAAAIVRLAYIGSASGSKLRQYVIDALRSDVADERVGEQADGLLSAARETCDIGLDYIRACFNKDGHIALNPSKMIELYLIGEAKTEDGV